MRLVSAAVAMSLILSSATALAQSSERDSRPVRRVLALLAPVTGPHGHIGQRVERVARFAADGWGDVEIRVFDTADDPRAAFQRAVASEPLAIVGPVGALESAAVAEAASEARMPVALLTGAAGVEDGRQSVGRLRTSQRQIAEAAVAIARDAAAGGTLAVLAPNDEVGDEAVVGAVAAASGTPLNVVRVARYEAGAADVRDAVEELVGLRSRRLQVPSDPWRNPPRSRLAPDRSGGSRADILFLPDVSEQVAAFLPALRFHGWVVDDIERSVRLIGTPEWLGRPLELVADVAAGARIPVIFHVDSPRGAVESFVTEHVLRFDEVPTAFDAEVFDAVSFLLTWGGTRRGLPLGERYVFDGVCGRMWLDGDGGVVRALEVWEIDGLGSAFPVATVSPSGVER